VTCKECDKETHKKWQEANPEKVAEKNKRNAENKNIWARNNREEANFRSRNQRKKERKFLIDHYGGKCACCGESRIEFLAIDHIDGGGTEHRERVGKGWKFYQWLRREGYPKGFRVLCHNCNLAIGFYGYCPHTLPTYDENTYMNDNSPSKLSEFYVKRTARNKEKE